MVVLACAPVVTSAAETCRMPSGVQAHRDLDRLVRRPPRRQPVDDHDADPAAQLGVADSPFEHRDDDPVSPGRMV